MRFICLLIVLSTLLSWAGAQEKPKKALFEDVFNDLPIKDPVENSGVSPGENPEAKIRGNILVIPHLSSSVCFPGEPVRVNYELYTTLKSTSEIIKFPTLQGFIVKKFLPENEFPVTKTINGKQYRVFKMLEYHLYPIDSGKLIIDSISIRNTVTYIDGGNKKSYGGDISSKALYLRVIPFPEKSRPASFTGAVGFFDVKLSHTSDLLNVNDVDTIMIEISGQGNLSNIKLPGIVWPEGVEAFESQRIDKFTIGRFPDSGSVIFRYPVLVRTAGIIDMEAITFSFFNPATKNYIEANSEKLSFKVLPVDSVAFVPTFSKEESVSVSKWNWLYAGLAAIICSFAFGLFWKERKKRKMAELKIAEMEVMASAAIEPEAEVVDSKIRFLDTLNGLRLIEHPLLYIQAVKDLLKSYLAEESGGDHFTEEELVKIFTDKDEFHGAAVNQLIEECNQYIYSGIPIPESYQQRLEKTLREIINHQTIEGNE